jgi:hypothetical protein
MAQDILEARPIPSATGSVFEVDLVADFLQLRNLAVAILGFGTNSRITYKHTFSKSAVALITLTFTATNLCNKTS